ncbi:MAG: hypothetical protein JAY74_28240 [Candidatus Thiodiazotropha taylori]|nr:hypothetical protein [Candidatus Thiodiazotropha taylori]
MARKDDALRTIDKDQWTPENLFQLKRVAEKIAENLFPDVISPLVEVDDIVGKYLQSSMPYTFTAALPYIAWSIHKYPPCDLKVEGFFKRKKLKPFWRFMPNHTAPVRVEPSISLKPLSVGLVRTVEENLLSWPGSKDGKSPEELHAEKLNDVREFLKNIYLKEDEDANQEFYQRADELISARSSEVYGFLDEIKENDLIAHLTKGGERQFEGFDEIVKSFETRINVIPPFSPECAADVIKYRLLLYVLIIFLRVAGKEENIDYTIDGIKEYRNLIAETEDSRFSGIRKALDEIPAHSSKPDGRSLDRIRSYADKLLRELNGRTGNYDLLSYLEKLRRAEQDDFDTAGNLEVRKNIPVRAFIKSLAELLCSYNFDYMLMYRAALSADEYKQEAEELSAHINEFVKKASDMFFYDVAISYVKENTSDVINRMTDIVTDRLGLLCVSNPPPSGDGDLLKGFISSIDRNRSVSITQLRKLRNSVRDELTLKDKKALCDQLIVSLHNLDFWDNPFSYYGQVSTLAGDVELTQIQLPVYTQDELDDAVVEAVKMIPPLRHAILTGQL